MRTKFGSLVFCGLISTNLLLANAASADTTIGENVTDIEVFTFQNTPESFSLPERTGCSRSFVLTDSPSFVEVKNDRDLKTASTNIADYHFNLTCEKFTPTLREFTYVNDNGRVSILTEEVDTVDTLTFGVTLHVQHEIPYEVRTTR